MTHLAARPPGAATLVQTEGERRRLLALAREHRVFVALAAVALLLRAAATIAERPVLMLYGDSYGYLLSARLHETSEIHPYGYSLLLNLLWWTGDLRSVVVFQHVLAVATAALLYVVLLRLGVSRTWAVIACVPLLFDAFQIVLEQFILAETLTEALLVALLAVLVWGPRLGWRGALAAGLLLAAAALTRSVALFVVVPVAVWLLLRRPGWRIVGVLAVSFAVPLLAYAGWYSTENHAFALDGNNGRWLYGRVESFADCGHLRLPADERGLCDQPKRAPVRADSWETGANWYTWDAGSPFARLRVARGVNRDTVAGDYARRVITQQPLTYLGSVVAYTGHYLFTSRTTHAGDWPTACWRFLDRLKPRAYHCQIGDIKFSDQSGRRVNLLGLPPQRAHPPVAQLAAYQRVAYLPGVAIFVAILAGLLAPVLSRRGDEPQRHRTAAALLFATTGAVLLVVPAATVATDYRYLLPVQAAAWPALALTAPFLAAAWQRAAGRWRRRAAVAGGE